MPSTAPARLYRVGGVLLIKWQMSKQKIIVALSETDRIMKEIDKIEIE